ncbi:MAG TPA: hypothetical protein VK081_08170, partial [Planctomycetota bacterium]|nr:hypothetical protein [Planctomycetota bacterium]
ERCADRVNPIFLRELQQALNAKSFLGVVALALATVFFIGLMIALRVDRELESGRGVFIPTLMVLLPVMTMVLPMQAFNSMQHELREGAIDQLLMSELTPRRIVRGKLLASALLGMVFMAMFAPLLAVCYLLRGIDVATIAICLSFAFLFGLAAAAVGMAMGAVTLIKPLQHVARAGVSAALAALTIGLMGSVWGIVRDVVRLRTPADQQGLVVTGIAIVAGIVLMNMVAAAVLTHPHENRSTPFRVFPFALTGLAYGLAAWMARLPGELQGFSLVWTLACALGGIPFLLAGLTENRTLSPRVRTLVPKNRLLAALSVPFLPGSDRAMWFLVLLLGVPGLAAWVCAGASPRSTVAWMERLVLFACAYVLIWGCVLRMLRGNRPGQRPRIHALVGLLFLFAVVCAVPMVVDLARFGEVEHWSWLHLLNPFFTMNDSGSFGEPRVLAALYVLGGVLLLLRLPGMFAGVREVLEASRARAR